MNKQLMEGIQKAYLLSVDKMTALPFTGRVRNKISSVQFLNAIASCNSEFSFVKIGCRTKVIPCWWEERNLCLS